MLPLKCIIVVIAIFVIMCTPSILSSQDFVAKVVLIIAKLPLDKQDRVRNLDTELKEYIEHYDYSNGSLPNPLSVNIQIFFESVETSYEDRYKARFVINCANGANFVDREWRFRYNVGEALQHDPYEYEPFLGLIDFYLYLILADELDYWELYGGNPFLEMALDLANRAKYSPYLNWWDRRMEKARKLKDQRHQPFRKMARVYSQASYYLEENNPTESLKFVVQILDLLESLVEDDIEHIHCVDFLNRNHQELLQLTLQDTNGLLTERLIGLDPKHKEYYENYQ